MTDKKRSNDQDDFALFRQHIGDVEQIKPHNKTPYRKSTVEVSPAPKKVLAQKVEDSLFVDNERDLVGNEEKLNFQRPGIQKKVFSQLRSGQFKMQAELDLHGMTTSKAHQHLQSFIEQCQQLNLRFVRIIHGKGWSSAHHKPIIKTMVNQWLRNNPAVLAFCSARIEDGGSGALYVILKRIKSEP